MPRLSSLPDQILQRMQEFYILFFAEGRAGLWSAEFDVPLRIDASVEEQASHVLTFGFISECNKAIARMLGYATSENVISRRLPQTVLPQGTKSEQLVKRFVRSQYVLRDVDTVATDRRGFQKHFLTSMIGIIQNDHLVRIWGAQQDITSRIRAHERHRSLIAQLTAKQLKILHLTVEGRSLKEIGHELSISPKTDDTIRHRLIKKIQVQSVHELVILATRIRSDGDGTKRQSE